MLETRQLRHAVRLAARRRCLTVAVVVALGTVSATVDAAAFAEPPTTEVWIDLSEPVAASSAGPAEATRQAERVTSQQDRVGDRLRALGIAELARVRHARNAMLVRATSEQVVFLSGIPGVVRVRPVDTLHPPKPMP